MVHTKAADDVHEASSGDALEVAFAGPAEGLWGICEEKGTDGGSGFQLWTEFWLSPWNTC